MKMPNLWLEPISKEIEILRARNIFEVIQRPKDKDILGSKWVYIVKWNKNKELDKRKAKIIVKGYAQVIGKDYDETYALVMHLESVWLVCTIAVTRRLCLWQVNFVSAFLNSENSFNVYMEQSRGFKEGKDNIFLYSIIQQSRWLVYQTPATWYNIRFDIHVRSYTRNKEYVSLGKVLKRTTAKVLY